MRGESRITVSASDRCIAAGMTGSGKTYLMRRLCSTIGRLVIIDPKSTLDGWAHEDNTPAAWSKLERGDKVRIRVVYEDDDTFETALERAYEIGDCTVYIDELYAINETGKRSRGLTRVLTRGRELGVGLWAATQRPAYCPLFAISEANHYFVFRLALQEDRDRFAAFMGPEVREPVRDEHGFFYSRAGDEHPRYFKELGG